MKKLTDFIVDKKYFILVFVCILSGISFYIGGKVKINYDIAEYLPSDSETRIGMDLMEENFDVIKESSLSVMFKDLEDDEKYAIKEELESISSVEEVLYDDSDDYNKDEYTLYLVNVADTNDSKAAKEVYDEVNDKYSDYEFYLGGSIEDYNKPVLKMWIVVFAVCCAMVILIIMCDSYIEPFLFLFVILLAIALNKGTNIIFPNVSHITNAISAILQMALSMDYSIMLMNRYTQEKAKEKNKDKAMKKALYNSFKSISSSSVTTIVGLLALVFMSFTIGRDLGFVLAKGVLFSLITIFLCLPALILLFDSLITKTRKKSLSISLDLLGKFSYKFRYVIFTIFIIAFVAAFIIKGNLGILYTDIETDEIGKHFKENNQIVVIYDNKYENEIRDYCKNLEDEEVKKVLCYGNTINDEIEYQDLNDKFKELGNDTYIDDYLLKIIYYNYYSNNDNKLSLNEFIKFVESDIYTNEEFSDKIDLSTKNNLNKLKHFATKEESNKKRTSKEIASILGVDKSVIDSVFVLYNSNTTTTLEVNKFIDFLNSNVLKDQKYASMISKDNQEMIKRLIPFMDKTKINTSMNSTELSNLFGVDKNSVDSLLLFYYVNNNVDTKLSLNEFILKTSYLKSNTNYLDGYDVSSVQSLVSVAKNDNNINALSMNQAGLNMYFSSINPTLVDTVYAAASLPSSYQMTPIQFIDFTLTNLGSNLDDATKGKLQLLKLVIASTLDSNSTKYSVSEMASLLSYDAKTINSLYALINISNGYEVKISPVNFVSVIVGNKDNRLISSAMDETTLNNLVLLNSVMQSINTNRKLSAKEMALMFNIDETDTKLIYSLYDIQILNKNITMSVSAFDNYILTNVVNNKKFSSSFDNKSITKLKNIKKIMDNSLANKKYSNKDLYKVLTTVSDDVDSNMVDLVYLYEGSVNNYDDNWTFTIQDFVTYLHDDILTDSRFEDFIDDNKKNDINTSYSDIKTAKDLLKGDKYSRMIINTTYSLEDKDTFDFIQSIKDDLKTENKDIYVIGDSPMAYDMSQSFNGELNIITILTMIFIFIVVAITFKSVIVPLILVLIIQCAVYITMSNMVLFGGSVYFIALLIVQSILMGATIDYAIVYTSYYKESRATMDVKSSIINAYNKSIHTILTSASILIIVTLIVGNFASAIAAKICMTLSQGTLCSVILVLFVLPAVLVTLDKFIHKKKN